MCSPIKHNGEQDMTNTLLRPVAVCKRLGCGRTHLYECTKEGTFRPPVKISERWSAWPEHEVDAILTARIAGASDDELRALVARLVENRKQAWADTQAELAQEAA